MEQLLIKLALILVLAFFLKAVVSRILRAWDQAKLRWMTKPVRPPDRFKLIWFFTVPFTWLLIGTDRDYWRFRSMSGIGCWSNNTRAFYSEFAMKRRELERKHPNLRQDTGFWGRTGANEQSHRTKYQKSKSEHGNSNQGRQSQNNSDAHGTGRAQAENVFALKGQYSHNDLKAAYRTLTKVAHPDVGGHDTAMAQANAAYSLLCKLNGWT